MYLHSRVDYADFVWTDHPSLTQKNGKSYRSSKAALLRKFKEKVCTGAEPGKTAVRHFVTLLLPTKGHLWNDDLQKFHSDDV